MKKKHRVVAVAATVALGVAAGAVPSSAGAADAWRCSATPLGGTLLGQAVPANGVGSATGACANASSLPSLQLPDPLAGLLKVDVVNGVTTVSGQGAAAEAGMTDVTVGSVPVPLPAGTLPVPDQLKHIDVPLPGTSTPVATVDLTPAIDAIAALPSKSLLDLGVLSSTVTGTCDGATPAIKGGSRIVNADVLGLPVDASKAVDTTVNLLDTTGIALDTLDLGLAKVRLLGGVVGVSTADVLAALKPILATLPPIEVPAELARVKLTPSTQQTVDGMLVQRALRAEISLGGQSIADLSIATAAVGGGPCAASATAPELALQCTRRKLALIDVLPAGDHVRLYGAADKSLAGRTVKIVFQATHRVVARVKVKRDGSFSTRAPMPPARVRATNRARYIARTGHEKSLNLKLMRRMVVDEVRSRHGKVTIRGRVVPPLAATPQTITLKRRVTCRKLQVVKRFKPRRDGSFTVTVKSPKNLAATVYRLQTHVRQSSSNPKLYPTFTLPRAVDL